MNDKEIISLSSENDVYFMSKEAEKLEKELKDYEAKNCDSLDFDELENELEEQLSELEYLEEEGNKIGDPGELGQIIKDVVWEQFLIQIGIQSGKDFIEENGGKTLDPRDKAHIQTTDGFVKEEIATNNSYIDYGGLHKKYEDNFKKNPDGTFHQHRTRRGNWVNTLQGGTRAPYDKGRPKGNREIHMDHIISAAEILRDPEAMCHLSQEELIDFANSEWNLHEMNGSHNHSKNDLPMKDWLFHPNSRGQKPEERYADPMSADYLSPELKEEYLKRDEIARQKYNELKREGKERSEVLGRKSQLNELKRLGKGALRAVVMTLFAGLVKEIIDKLVKWFKSANRKFQTFIEAMKDAIKKFIKNLKEHLKEAGKVAITAILTTILDPIVGVIKKAWLLLKQGWQSLKQAIEFLRNPANKDMPLTLKLMYVSKIMVAAVSAGGAIVLSEVLEKSLLTIPFFNFQIPLLGSLANITGMLLGGLICGIIGALALFCIDKKIAKTMKSINTQKKIDKANDILIIQEVLIKDKKEKTEDTRKTALEDIDKRHEKGAEIMKNKCNQIKKNSDTIDNSEKNNNDDSFKKISDNLNF